MDQTRRAFLRLTRPLRSLEQGTPLDHVDYAPSIDVARCNGCDACVRVCADDALSLDRSEVQPYYRIDASRCSGCRLCMDVCDRDAITFHQERKAVVRRIELAEGVCTACGARFHEPARGSTVEGKCRICRSRSSGRLRSERS